MYNYKLYEEVKEPVAASLTGILLKVMCWGVHFDITWYHGAAQVHFSGLYLTSDMER